MNNNEKLTIIHAEDVNYWKTGKSSADTWLDKAKSEIGRVGGQVLGSGSFTEETTGRSAFMLAFNLDGESFQLKWPVLKSKTDNMKAARIQAATALYHEVKAACVKVKFLGARSAFFAYLMLPDGRTASEAGSAELAEVLPALLGGSGHALLLDGEL